MNRKSLAAFLITALTLLALVSCRTTGVSGNTININGMVYDFDNRPVPYCEIQMGWWHKGVTDINGRFILPNVHAGVYPVKVTRSGYETYTEEITAKDNGLIIYLRIPSQAQLLNLADQALTANDYAAAEDLADRAYQIDKKSAEALFYRATVKFRQSEYEKAISILEDAVALGIKDIYIEKFINTLKELINAE